MLPEATSGSVIGQGRQQTGWPLVRRAQQYRKSERPGLTFHSRAGDEAGTAQQALPGGCIQCLPEQRECLAAGHQQGAVRRQRGQCAQPAACDGLRLSAINLGNAEHGAAGLQLTCQQVAAAGCGDQANGFAAHVLQLRVCQQGLGVDAEFRREHGIDSSAVQHRGGAGTQREPALPGLQMQYCRLS